MCSNVIHYHPMHDQTRCVCVAKLVFNISHKAWVICNDGSRSNFQDRWSLYKHRPMIDHRWKLPTKCILTIISQIVFISRICLSKVKIWTTRFKNRSLYRTMTSDWLVNVSDDQCTTSYLYVWNLHLLCQLNEIQTNILQWIFVNILNWIKLGSSCLMLPSKGTLKYGHIRQVVTNYRLTEYEMHHKGKWKLMLFKTSYFLIEVSTKAKFDYYYN